MTVTLFSAVPDSAGPIGTHARTRSALGLRIPPRLEPPYDDESPPDRCPLGDRLPFEEPSPRRLEHDVDFFDPQPTSRSCLPEPGPWAAHFVRAAVEMLAGRRPMGQLRRWATLPAVAGVESAARRGSGQHPDESAVRAAPTGSTSPATSANPTNSAKSAKLGDALHSVHVSEPADGVAEVCAVIRQGRRYRALAARLEGLDGRWQCVSFRLL